MVERGETVESAARSYRIEPEDVEACVQYKAMGKKLSSNFKRSDIERLMDDDDTREREDAERPRAPSAKWDGRATA